MSYKKQVVELLTKQPLARERKNRARAIWAILCQNKYETLNKEQFCEKFSDIMSIDRWIRKVQEENEDLRGDDYGDKKALEQDKMLELGYFPGLSEDLKKLTTLR